MEDAEKKGCLAVDPVWSEVVARVAASSGLAKSPRLRSLLQYLCERTWAGTADELRESTVGQEVFARPRGYDTASENIVRVSVSQLRKRLEQYFTGEGANEPLVITIPKGRYAVEFVPRALPPPQPEPPAAPMTPLPATPTTPLKDPAPSRNQPLPRGAWWTMIAFVAVGAVLLLAPWRWASPASAIASHERFWRAVFTPGRDVYIVVADSGFGLLQDVTGQSLTFEQYLSGRGPAFEASGANPQQEELIRRLVSRQYTSVSDASIAFQLGALSRASSSRMAVRSARSINIRDLKVHNIILLGSARSNPWVGLLSDKLNFFVDYEEQPPRGVVRNHKPQAGEPEVFKATARSGQPGDAYGLVSWLPNLDATGSIVTISGTNMEGTEAAAEVLLSPASFEKLRTRLAIPIGEAFPRFEAVIRASSRAGAGSGAEIVAFRKLAAN